MITMMLMMITIVKIIIIIIRIITIIINIIITLFKSQIYSEHGHSIYQLRGLNQIDHNQIRKQLRKKPEEIQYLKPANRQE